MKALISPNEVVTVKTQDGELVLSCRVAQVDQNGFEIAQPLHWIDCPDEVTAETHYYDLNESTFKLIPDHFVEPSTVITGAQTL